MLRIQRSLHGFFLGPMQSSRWLLEIVEWPCVAFSPGAVEAAHRVDIRRSPFPEIG